MATRLKAPRENHNITGATAQLHHRRPGTATTQTPRFPNHTGAGAHVQQREATASLRPNAPRPPGIAGAPARQQSGAPARQHQRPHSTSATTTRWRNDNTGATAKLYPWPPPQRSPTPELPGRSNRDAATMVPPPRCTQHAAVTTAHQTPSRLNTTTSPGKVSVRLPQSERHDNNPSAPAQTQSGATAPPRSS